MPDNLLTISQIENRYKTQSGILEGDILYTAGAAVEDGTYQGASLQQLISLDTSCRKKFGKLVKDADLEQGFKGMFIFFKKKYQIILSTFLIRSGI